MFCFIGYPVMQVLFQSKKPRAVSQFRRVFFLEKITGSDLGYGLVIAWFLPGFLLPPVFSMFLLVADIFVHISKT